MNEQEFNRKVIPLSSKLLKLSYGILGCSNQAKDAVQEVFVKLWRDRSKLNELISIEAYARSVTRNHCLDVLRTKRDMLNIDKVILLNPESNCEEFENEVNHKLDMIKVAMIQLNEQQQQVFTMRDIEGLEFDAISEMLGITAENARVTLSRARRKIREMIENSIKKKV